MTSTVVRVRLAIIGLGLGLVLGIAAPRASGAPQPAASRTIYHKSRSFRVPFNIDPADLARYKEVQLWVSDDLGETWKAKTKTTPDHPAFTFRAPRDAEYWFTVRTIDTQGRAYPGLDEEVEPKLKVIVDTIAPTLDLFPGGRRNSYASVRWEVADKNLDLKSLVLEYQVGGVREWRQVPIRRPALIGSESWDVGSSEPLRVRATISDRAGNMMETVVDLPEGSSARPNLASNEYPESAPPPIAQISSGPNYRPPTDEPPANAASTDPFTSTEAPRAQAPPANDSDPFPEAARTAPADNFSTPSGGRPNRTILVSSPRFPLDYKVDDAGPNGPNTVELWVTQDGGRTWNRRGEDPDKTSPFPVDVGGEGVFGLCLVALSASGLGDQPPAPGDPPQFWVEVDSTPPDIQLLTPKVGTGQNAGKVAIDWRATDTHLAPRPVFLSWRTDQAGSNWVAITPQPIDNTGRYIWNVPPSVPPKFHLRIEVVDQAGNRGVAETTETGAVIVDRARPRSRILGISQDPNSRTGAAPQANPIR